MSEQRTAVVLQTAKTIRDLPTRHILVLMVDILMILRKWIRMFVVVLTLFFLFKLDKRTYVFYSQSELKKNNFFFFIKISSKSKIVPSTAFMEYLFQNCIFRLGRYLILYFTLTFIPDFFFFLLLILSSTY